VCVCVRARAYTRLYVYMHVAHCSLFSLETNACIHACIYTYREWQLILYIHTKQTLIHSGVRITFFLICETIMHIHKNACIVVFAYAYMHENIYVCMRPDSSTDADTCIYTHTHVLTYAHTCIRTCLPTRIQTRLHTYKHTLTFVYTHVRIHAYTRIHTSLHMHIHVCR
jgi:hypothetical protein